MLRRIESLPALAFLAAMACGGGADSGGDHSGSGGDAATACDELKGICATCNSTSTRQACETVVAGGVEASCEGAKATYLELCDEGAHTAPACDQLASTCDTCTDASTRQACEAVVATGVDASCETAEPTYAELCSGHASSCAELESTCATCFNTSDREACLAIAVAGIEANCENANVTYTQICDGQTPLDYACEELQVACLRCVDTALQEGCQGIVDQDDDASCATAQETYDSVCPKPAIIAGQVTNAVGPVAGAQVEITDGGGILLESVETDTDGRYTISTAPVGSASLRATKQNSQSENLYEPFTQEVQLEADAHLFIDVALQVTLDLDIDHVNVGSNFVTWVMTVAECGEVVLGYDVYATVNGGARTTVAQNCEETYYHGPILGEIIPVYGSASETFVFDVCVTTIEMVEKCMSSDVLSPVFVGSYIFPYGGTDTVRLAEVGDTVSYATTLAPHATSVGTPYEAVGVGICIDTGTTSMPLDVQLYAYTPISQTPTEVAFDLPIDPAPRCSRVQATWISESELDDVSWYFVIEGEHRVPESGTFTVTVNP